MVWRLRQRVATLALVGMLVCLGSTAFAKGEPNLKIGLDRLSWANVTYTHETIATSTEVTNNDALSGADAFVEWIASDHFGLEVVSTIAPLTRSYKLGGTTPVSDNVNETASLTTLGVNLYFTRATRKGFQYSIGVATGTVSVKQEFEGGSLGKQSTSNTISITAVKFGMEWITELAGVRLQYQSTSGATSNTTELTGVKQTVDYSGGLLSLGVFAFF